MTGTQKALRLQDKLGDFKVDTVPISEPGPGEILVKIYATGLCPADWIYAKNPGLTSLKEYPATFGLDGSGTVEKLGEGVTTLQVGDKVCASCRFSWKEKSYIEHSFPPLVCSRAMSTTGTQHSNNTRFHWPISQLKQVVFLERLTVFKKLSCFE